MSEEEELDVLKKKSIEFSEERIEELKKNKTPVKINNGVMLIDKDHPDYEYWVED